MILLASHYRLSSRKFHNHHILNSCVTRDVSLGSLFHRSIYPLLHEYYIGLLKVTLGWVVLMNMATLPSSVLFHGFLSYFPMHLFHITWRICYSIMEKNPIFPILIIIRNHIIFRCYFFLVFKDYFFYLHISFLEKGEERERSINMWEKHPLALSDMPPTRYLAHNPGMCPNLELNQQPFGS